MALPTTIISIAGRQGYTPPFKSSGGSFYALVNSHALTADINVYKADGDDPTDAWTVQDATNNPVAASAVIHIASVQDGDVIHIISMEGSQVLRYSTFNMSTDAWVIVSELIQNIADPPTYPWASIAVRSDGDVIFAYAGDTDQVMGGKKERVDYARRESGIWTAGIALDAGGDIHNGNPTAIKADNADDIHFLWQRTNATADPPISWAGVRARSLDSSNTLSTTDLSTGTAYDTFNVLLGTQTGVSWDDSGTQRMVFDGGRYATSDNVRRYQTAQDGGIGEIDLGGSAQHSEVGTNGPTDNGETFVSTIAEHDGIVHQLYGGGGARGVDQDIYYTKSDDNGNTWDTPTEELDAVTCNYISANIYVRGSDTVLAYVYDDGGTTKYNEKVLPGGGTAYNQSVAGAFTPSGVRILEIDKALAGVIAPSGAFSRDVTLSRSLVGSIAPAGDSAKSTFKSFIGSLTPTSVLSVSKMFVRAIAGALAPAGALVKKTFKFPSGVLTPVGILNRASTFVRSLAGSLTPTGAFSRTATFFRAAAGSFTPTGVVSSIRTFVRVVGGTLAPIGALIKDTSHNVVGTFTPTGTISRVGTFLRTVTGALTPTGATIKRTFKSFAGALTPSGIAAGIKQVGGPILKAIAGALTPSSSNNNTANSINENGTSSAHFVNQPVSMSSASTYTYSVYLKADNRTWAFLQAYSLPGAPDAYYNLSTGVVGGTTGPGFVDAGVVDAGNGWYRCWLTFLTGTVTTPNVLIASAASDGGVTYLGLTQQSILVAGAQLELGTNLSPYAATTTSPVPPNLLLQSNALNVTWIDQNCTNSQAVGADPFGPGLTKKTFKFPSGALTPSGAISTVTSFARSIAGALTPTGAAFKETLKSFAGSLTPSSVLNTLRVYVRLITGSLTPTGAIAKETRKGLAGALTPTGAFTKDIFKSLAGALTPISDSAKRTFKSFAGSLTPTSVLDTTIIFIRSVAGSLTPSGSITKRITRSIAGVLAPIGALVKRTSVTVAGALTPIGNLAKWTNKFFVGSLTPQGLMTPSSVFFQNVAGVLTFSSILGTLKGTVEILVDQFNDLIMAVTGPQIDEGRLQHYQANGATSNNLNDAEYQYLVARGIAPGVLADMWNTYLTGKGYSGNVTEMKHAWWKDIAPL